MIQFRMASWDAYGGVPIYLRDGKQPKQVEIYDMRLSPPLKASAPLVLLKKTGGTDEKGEFAPLLTVPITSGKIMPLVLLMESEGRLGSFVGECALSVVPYGSISVCNFSKEQIGVEVDQEKILLPPRGEKVFSLHSVTIGKPFGIRGFHQVDGKAKLVYDSAGMRREGSRMFLFFYPDADGKIRSKSMVDFVPPSERENTRQGNP